MAEKDQFSERDREQLAALGIRPVSPLAVRLWAAGGAVLAYDLIIPVAHTFWTQWSNRYVPNFDLNGDLNTLLNSDSSVSTSAAWVTVKWICIGLIRLNRHHVKAGEFFMVALMPALSFFLLAIVGGILMTRFKFTTRVPRTHLRNDFIKSGQWWGWGFVLVLSAVLVWYVGLFQVSIWQSQLESVHTTNGFNFLILERVRGYFRTAGVLMLAAGVLLGGLGQIRFILRYRGRVDHFVRLSRD